MGVLATLTYLDGTTVTQFLLDSDLDAYTAVGDVQIKIIYPNIPDYVINTLSLTTAQKDLNMQLTPQQLTSLFLQGGIISADDPAALAAASQGKFTLQNFINTFLNENQAPPSVGGSVAPAYQLQITKGQFTPDGKTVQLAITATPIGDIPSGAKNLQFNVQITDKKTGKITNDDSFKTAIDGNPAYATFDENVPIGVNDVFVNVYLIEPDAYVSLAEPLLNFEVNGNPTVLGTSNKNLVRDAVIGAALAVGVPVAIIFAYKHHKKGKNKK